MQIQEILIIKNGRESYGISTEDINQISRVPMLMQLPLRPNGVRGLCSVAGSIVSMLDLNLLLDVECVDYDAYKSRLLSLNTRHSSNALLVSEVYNTVEINQENIEYIDKKDDPIIAIYKYQDTLVQVLSLDVLVSKMSKVNIESQEVKTGKVKHEITKEEDSIRFLIFYMGREKFALNIEYLQEIILVDKEFTEINNSNDDILGLITLRDELLLVIDLRITYGFDTLKSDKNRILIASYNQKRVGLLIDSVIDIRNFTADNIEIMENESKEIHISGVIHDDHSLISFLDYKILEKLFNDNQSYIEDKDKDKDDRVENSNDFNMEVIVFKLATKEYAFEVDNVDEIIDFVQSTEIVYSNEFIDGIINIRGQIVTIVSLFKKLDIQDSINEDSKIIICNIKGNRIGFVVDSVSDILTIKEDNLREKEDDLFTNILHLNDGKRLVLLMDINTITDTKERLDG
ncbi:MAG: chemotaxis protein CheW [Campylobacterota bacterium]|nr:chemotaxis protein CheW [Campylobacterota bacterium]